MQVSIDSEINSLEHEKSKHTCIFIYYHLPNVGAVGSEVLILVSVEELSFGLCFLLAFFFNKSINTHQHIGFSTQNNTILCNQICIKILSALK
jgi:hypothetical protein